MKPKLVPQVSKTRSDPLPRLRGSALTQFPGSRLPLPCVAFEHAFLRRLGMGSWGGGRPSAPGSNLCSAPDLEKPKERSPQPVVDAGNKTTIQSPHTFA